jgi:ABC-type amino acid transport substrate-binding protein
MKNNRLRLVGVLLAACLLVAGSAQADALDDVLAKGQLRVAVYKNFPPYSQDGRGVDVQLAQAIARKLGVAANLFWLEADENMADDLRNAVWKGHYLGGGTADVMMHVPVDPALQNDNPKVRILAPYAREEVMVAHDPAVLPELAGLESLAKAKIGVEVETIADAFLLSTRNGALRNNVVHFKTVPAAVAAMKDGKVAAVAAPRGELEGALSGFASRYRLSPLPMGHLAGQWTLGVAVKAEAGKLAQAVEKAMQELRSEGALEAIYQEHGLTYLKPGAIRTGRPPASEGS